MSNVKVFIDYPFVDGPWGGGNQFLKGLRTEFKKKGRYTESLIDAELVIVNSHHYHNGINPLSWINKLKKYKGKKILLRVDGPIFNIRGRNKIIDLMIFNFAKYIATGVVYQSDWSKNECIKLGMDPNHKSITVHNAANTDVFKKKTFENQVKKKLIATSWSANLSKGFDVYKFLDENLNFNKFDMTFVGNSPYAFNNIKQLKPLSSSELGKELSKHDIFITASENDTCSNSLVEALTVGLPAVVLNDGGHPELVGSGGLVFNGKFDVIQRIEDLSTRIKHYSDNIRIKNLEEVGISYYEFGKDLKKRNNINTKNILLIYFHWLIFKISDYIHVKLSKK